MPRNIAAEPPDGVSDPLDCGLPGWLARRLAWIARRRGDFQQPPAPRPPTEGVIDAEVDCAAEAIARIQPTAAPDPLDGFDAAAMRSVGNQSRRRFSAVAAGAGRQVPQLVRRLQRLRQLEDEFQTALQREKLAALRQFAYGAGHEVNNPLANISTRAQTLLRDETDPERRRMLATINSQAFRAHEMIADVMLFAHPPAPQFEAADLAAIVGRVLSELGPQAAEQQTELRRRGTDGPLPAVVDPVQIALALKALCVNSLEAIGRGGRVEVELQEADDAAHHVLAKGDAPAAPVAAIIVRDTGPGIAPEVRRHLFDPFFSGREAGRGLGFGLSKCWRIVALHGGQIEVESETGRGAVFTLRLPRWQGGVAPEPPAR